MTDQQPRKTIKLKPISKVPGAPAIASASPQSAPTIQSESFGDAPTVKLSPHSIINPSPAPVLPHESQAQPMLESTHTGTQPLKKMPTSAQTVPGTLIPQDFGNKMSLQGSQQTLVSPSMPTSVGQAMPNISTDEDESTQKIATAAKAVAKPQQQTIKLRPSTVSAPAAAPSDSAVSGAQTIKLGAMDQSASAATPAPSSGATIKLVPTATVTETAAIRPSAPTIRLSPTQQTPMPGDIKPSAPTIKLSAGSQTTKAESAILPGAQTIQLSPEAQAQAVAADEAHPQKTKLVIKKPDAASGMSEMHEGQLSPGGGSGSGEKEKDEPSMIFTLVAVFSMIIAGYLFFMSAAQYANHWMGKSIPVPGISSSK